MQRNLKTVDWDNLPHGGDLFGEMELAAREGAGVRKKRPPLFPGLALCGVAAAAAAWLSGHYGFPIILLGLLVGLALNFVSQDPRTHAGLDFASRTCLRWGIVVLGLQVTFEQIGALGVAPFIALLAGDGGHASGRPRRRRAGRASRAMPGCSLAGRPRFAGRARPSRSMA